MNTSRKRLFLVAAAACAAALTWAFHSASRAQLGERPGTSRDDPADMPCDLTGLSIKNPRVRVVHTKDPRKRGGSMYLQQVDPWLGYRWGWSLTQREFRERDGVYGQAGKLDGLLLADGVSRMMSRSHVNSCAICHNTPTATAAPGPRWPRTAARAATRPICSAPASSK